MQPDLKDAAKLTFRSGCLFLEDRRHSILDSRRKGKAAPDGRPHTWWLPTPLIYSDATGLITIKDLGRLHYPYSGHYSDTQTYVSQDGGLTWGGEPAPNDITARCANHSGPGQLTDPANEQVQYRFRAYL